MSMDSIKPPFEAKMEEKIKRAEERARTADGPGPPPFQPATYVFRIDWINVHEIRDNERDRLYYCIGTKVDDGPSQLKYNPEPRPLHMGEGPELGEGQVVKTGYHQVDFESHPVHIASPDSVVRANFQIWNVGFPEVRLCVTVIMA